MTEALSGRYQVIDKPSAHFDERLDQHGNEIRPSFLILHYTETENAQIAEDYFLGTVSHPTGGRVSVHYMIDETGHITRYVDEQKRAWHAGVSFWDGITDINSHSVGIELVNPGHQYGYRPFPAAQMMALRYLAADIIARHHITPDRVLAHSDIAPARKIDPGELFDWRLLATHGIGHWPVPLAEQDYKCGDDYRRDESALAEALSKVGYDPAVKLPVVITAFQRHYCPEAFRAPHAPGQLTRTMSARLHWLVRHKPRL